MADYVIWAADNVPHACVLDELSGVDDQTTLYRGVPLQDGFPGDARYSMDEEYPDDTVLVDNLINIDNVIVASKKLVQFLQGRELPKVEYLPVTIVDHKGRDCEEPYFLVHPIDPVDCMDLEESGAEWDSIAKDEVEEVESFVLDPDRVDPERPLFRCKHYFETALVRKDLADAIDAAGFVGIRWVPLDEWPEL